MELVRTAPYGTSSKSIACWLSLARTTATSNGKSTIRCCVLKFLSMVNSASKPASAVAASHAPASRTPTPFVGQSLRRARPAHARAVAPNSHSRRTRTADYVSLGFFESSDRLIARHARKIV
jgi:hypothetical protein